MDTSWLTRGARVFNLLLSKQGVDDLLTPLPQALAELNKRASNTDLRASVEHYLAGDIPDYLTTGPTLYLARHLATPNFETLRFLHLVEPLGLPTVIGQDIHDLFVPANHLKRAVAKLSISTGVAKNENGYCEQYKNITIVDFNAESGKPFHQVQTLWGENVVDFHSSLFSHTMNKPVQIADDSAWIGRHHRGNLLEHYKHFLALFIVHGVLFEDYLVGDPEEDRFIATVLRPAFRFIERRFGVRPLITNLNPTSVETPRFWLSYPQVVKDIAEARLKSANAPSRSATI